jgi:hypothetical protein
MKRLRERVFGGKAAILWLGRKRRSVAPTQAAPKQAAPKQVLRWDDELGRPIYDFEESTTASHSPSEEDEENSPVSPETKNPSPRPAESTGFTPFCLGKRGSKNNRRAVFGSRNIPRMRDTDDLFALASYLDAPFFKTHSTSLPFIKHDEAKASTISSDSSPDHKLSRRLSTTSETSCKDFSSDDSSKVAPVTDEKPDSEFDAEDEDTLNAPGLESSTSELEDGSSKSVALPNKRSVFDFEETDEDMVRPQQPSSTTALDAARAYFQRLDSSPIPLEDVNKTKSPIRAVVRTRRRLRSTNPIVATEYTNYKATCQEADVEPMPIESFIKHRSDFVGNGGLYEGFLYE